MVVRNKAEEEKKMADVAEIGFQWRVGLKRSMALKVSYCEVSTALGGLGLVPFQKGEGMIVGACVIVVDFFEVAYFIDVGCPG